jgi:hypothetical protein
MPAVVTWKVVDMTRRTSDGMVEIVWWLAEAVDGDIAARRGGETVVPPGPPASFIPYPDLTEAICLGWVQDALGAAEVQAIEADLLAQIQEQISPSLAGGVPWASANVPELPAP